MIWLVINSIWSEDQFLQEKAGNDFWKDTRSISVYTNDIK